MALFAKSRPLSIILISLAYVLSPVGNILAASWSSKIDVMATINTAVKHFGPFGVALVLVAPVVGIGIFAGRKWGFALFLAHACSVLLDNGWLLVNGKGQQAFVESLVAIDVVVFGVVVLMLQKDLRAPYLATDPRGWRRSKRIERKLPVKLTVGDQTHDCESMNVSNSGILIRLTGVAISLGERVTVVVTVGGASHTLTGNVARTLADAVAIHYDESHADTAKKILKG